MEWLKGKKKNSKMWCAGSQVKKPQSVAYVDRKLSTLRFEN